MIIAIDGYEANVAARVGIGRYAYEVLKHMNSIRSHLAASQGATLRIYLPSDPLSDMPKETPWWQYRIIWPKKFWTLFGLPLALATDEPRPGVIFSPTHYVPRWTSLPRVMSIMDVSYLHYPDMFRPHDLYQLTHWTAYAVAHAKAIFTISEFSKGAIIKAYGVPAGRVVVTYPGVTMSNVKCQMSNVQEKYNIGKHYILSVGTLQPRKNYVRLIEAFARFLKVNKQKFGTVELVIVGKSGWLYEEILAAPGKYGVSDRVKFLDFVPDEDLAGLYENALCFALPSLYEGFGLPVLEAMARKVPVVVSQVSSLPEIAGNAGVYVDPENTDSITNGLLTAVRQKNLMQGRARIQAGLEQVKKFTWENAARKTLEVLENIGNT